MAERLLAVIEVPTVPAACVSANSRCHWRTRAAEIVRLHGIVRAEAMRRGLRRLAGPVDVEIEIVWSTGKRGRLLDADNCVSTAKALIDAVGPCRCRQCRRLGAAKRHAPCWAALGWEGLIADDGPRCVPGLPRVTIRKGPEGPRTTIRIRESGGADGGV